MNDYSFWRDFFDTYQSLPDGMKFLWLVVPPVFAFALTGLIMRYRLAVKRERHRLTGNLIYSIHRDEYDMFHVYLHGPENDAPEEVKTAPILSLVNGDKVKPLYPEGRK